MFRAGINRSLGAPDATAAAAAAARRVDDDDDEVYTRTHSRQLNGFVTARRRTQFERTRRTTRMCYAVLRNMRVRVRVFVYIV